MRVLIAPDKFKGSMTAREAAETIQDALGHDWSATCLPIADGGEGTAEALTDALAGEWIRCSARDPLGRVVESGYGLVPGPPKTAIIEMSHASGLWRLNPDELDPWVASTFGTGELIRNAVEKGAERILLGLGGSATNDGGSGMAKALGVRFLNDQGEDVEEIPRDLLQVRRIDVSNRLELPEFSAACDVSNPLLGSEGATRVYGPQKGVKESQLANHEERLEHLANLVGGDFREIPGSGAAGGLGFGCLAFCGATLEPGFELVADLLNLRAEIQKADLVITGEGSLDAQTLQGKGPHGVALLARELGKPVLAVAGRTDGAPRLEEEFDRVIVISPTEIPVAEAMERGGEFLRQAIALAEPWMRDQIPG
tara:strand:- start:17380 stop:18486 length:1107 start_codon:yes stop_codon:yes gene_type:complete